MNRRVIIRAEFASMDHYLSHAPGLVQFFYEDGRDLTPQDLAKVEAITKYYLDNGLYPIFVLEDKSVLPLVGEALINLMEWTANGIPTKGLIDINGRPIQTPIFKARKGKVELNTAK